MARKVAIVMAAGKGTRMKSDLPKVLVEVCSRPMIEYVLDALDAAGIDHSIVVVGYRADDVRRQLAPRPRVSFALQAEQLGTGHAVMMCRDQLAEHDGPVLVVAGDSPIMQPDSIRELLSEFDRIVLDRLLFLLRRMDPMQHWRYIALRPAAGQLNGAEYIRPPSLARAFCPRAIFTSEFFPKWRSKISP